MNIAKLKSIDSIFCFCKIEYNARKYKFKTFALP